MIQRQCQTWSRLIHRWCLTEKSTIARWSLDVMSRPCTLRSWLLRVVMVETLTGSRRRFDKRQGKQEWIRRGILEVIETDPVDDRLLLQVDVCIEDRILGMLMVDKLRSGADWKCTHYHVRLWEFFCSPRHLPLQEETLWQSISRWWMI